MDRIKNNASRKWVVIKNANLRQSGYIARHFFKGDLAKTSEIRVSKSIVIAAQILPESLNRLNNLVRCGASFLPNYWCGKTSDGGHHQNRNCDPADLY